jgi:MarR family 2-MHQ and catechol resistance regulon transcriptional repressor
METQPTLAWGIMQALNATHYDIVEQAKHDLEGHGLTPTEFMVLRNLHLRGALTLGDVGSCAQLTSGSTTYVIDKLEQRGLLARRPCDRDRRVIHTQLTSEGEALMRKVIPEHEAFLDRITGILSAAEKQVLCGLLRKMRGS